jgi:hypothetical protein
MVISGWWVIVDDTSPDEFGTKALVMVLWSFVSIPPASIADYKSLVLCECLLQRTAGAWGDVPQHWNLADGW